MDRLQDHCVHRAEDYGVGHYAQRQGRRCYYREPGLSD
jgi:hypothetical protein